MSRRRNDPPPPSAHAAAADAFLAAGAAASRAADAAIPRAPRLGEVVLWRAPEEWRRWDVADRLGAEVPAVVARVRPDGSLDLHPLPPFGAPPLRVELTRGVAPPDVRPLED